jgi:hypothetical protein
VRNAATLSSVSGRKLAMLRAGVITESKFGILE